MMSGVAGEQVKHGSGRPQRPLGSQRLTRQSARSTLERNLTAIPHKRLPLRVSAATTAARSCRLRTVSGWSAPSAAGGWPGRARTSGGRLAGRPGRAGRRRGCGGWWRCRGGRSQARLVDGQGPLVPAAGALEPPTASGSAKAHHPPGPVPAQPAPRIMTVCAVSGRTAATASPARLADLDPGPLGHRGVPPQPRHHRRRGRHPDPSHAAGVR
jgi:hypothetical protein